MENLQIPTPERGFANLTNDFMFKRIFGQVESKDVLITFLNHFIGNGEMVDVEFLNTEHLPPTAEDKKVVFDINVRTQDGTEYIIEMQLLKQEHFHERALYYTAYPIISQGLRAKADFKKEHPNYDGPFKWDFNLRPVRFIAILNFDMNHATGWKNNKYQSSYRLYEDNAHELLHDKLQFMFLGLERFNKTEAELETIYDKWMYLFKNMKFLKERPDVFDEKEFDRLFELAKISNFTQNEYMEYQKIEFGESDYYNALDYAKKERNLEIARNMLKKNEPEEKILEYTGISSNDFLTLKKDL